jgi:hypothetical protein
MDALGMRWVDEGGGVVGGALHGLYACRFRALECVFHFVSSASLRCIQVPWMLYRSNTARKGEIPRVVDGEQSGGTRRTG